MAEPEKVPYEELARRINIVRDTIKLARCYQHYKTKGVYMVRGFAIHEATQDILVLYTPNACLDVTMARPASEWSELVDEGMAPRFRLCD